MTDTKTEIKNEKEFIKNLDVAIPVHNHTKTLCFHEAIANARHEEYGDMEIVMEIGRRYIGAHFVGGDINLEIGFETKDIYNALLNLLVEEHEKNLKEGTNGE